MGLQTNVDDVTEIINIDVKKTDDTVDLLKVNPVLPAAAQAEIREIFRNYLQTNRPEVPRIEAEISLSLREHQPFDMPPRRLSYAEKSEVRIILDNLLDKGIIRPSQSKYASPIVLREKKNGDTRMCVDYRTLK